MRSSCHVIHKATLEIVSIDQVMLKRVILPGEVVKLHLQLNHNLGKTFLQFFPCSYWGAFLLKMHLLSILLSC